MSDRIVLKFELEFPSFFSWVKFLFGQFPYYLDCKKTLTLVWGGIEFKFYSNTLVIDRQHISVTESL